MRQPGEITKVSGDMMQVTFCRPEACAACRACEGGKKEHTLWVRGTGRVGEIAIVEMPEKMIAKASFLAYGLPLLTLLAGMILGNLAGGGTDTGTAAGAAIGLGAGALMLAVTEKRRKGKAEWSPRLVDVIGKNAETGEGEREFEI